MYEGCDFSYLPIPNPDERDIYYTLNPEMRRIRDLTLNKYGLNESSMLGLIWLASIRKQIIEKKFTYFVSFDGRHRSGKSLTAVTLAGLIDPTFNRDFEWRVVQTPQEFMKAITNIKDLNIKGAVIVVDEAGVSLSASDWYESWMKIIAKTLQMFGYLYILLFFVAPKKDYIDSRIRKMFHAHFSIERTSTEYTVIMPRNIVYSLQLNKYFYVRPRVRFYGKTYILSSVRFYRPPKEIEDRYTALTENRKDDLIEEFQMDIQDILSTDKGEDEQAVRKNYINQVLKNPEFFMDPTYYRRKKKSKWVKLKLEMIEHKFGISTKEAKTIKTIAESELNKELLIERRKMNNLKEEVEEANKLQLKIERREGKGIKKRANKPKKKITNPSLKDTFLDNTDDLIKEFRDYELSRTKKLPDEDGL